MSQMQSKKLELQLSPGHASLSSHQLCRTSKNVGEIADATESFEVDADGARLELRHTHGTFLSHMFSVE